MINAVVSFVGGLFVLGIMCYILIDTETIRTLLLTKRAKRSYHKFANNRLEAIVFDVEKKLENK